MKEITARFIKDYHIINYKIVRTLYTLTRIGKTMQQLEGFHFATALDLNMGYYTIRILPSSPYIAAIVTKFDKFRYNRLPIGMCT